MKETIEQRQFDCVLFDHYFEIDGNIERKCNKHISQLKNGKMQRLSHLEYWLGGYNYKTVPTCGILFKRESFLKSGGYLKEEGYSVDESFMENFIRSGYKVFSMQRKWVFIHIQQIQTYQVRKIFKRSSSWKILNIGKK